jgi:hypothetical protein
VRLKSCHSEPWPRNLGSQFGLLTDLRGKGRLAGSVRWVQRLMSKRVQRFSNTQEGSEPFAKFSTLFLFSMVYKSVVLIRSAQKRFVLIVQPLQFHYSVVSRGICL